MGKQLVERSTCQSCGAAIRWVVTAKGKRMPLDAEPVANGNIDLDADGFAVYVKAEAGEVRFKSHFATCPDGANWRKR